MIKKLVIRKWVSAGPIILLCAGGGCALLSWYGAAALQGLRGITPKLAESQSMNNIYIWHGDGAFRPGAGGDNTCQAVGPGGGKAGETLSCE